jgi:hypothetical protein
MTNHKNKNEKPKCGARGRFLYLENETRQANCKRCLGQVKRRKNTNTVNRGWLMRCIMEGKVMVKSRRDSANRYFWDEAYDFRYPGWTKVRIEDDYAKREGKFVYFRRDDFRGFGHARREANGDIILSLGYCNYRMRLQ